MLHRVPRISVAGAYLGGPFVQKKSAMALALGKMGKYGVWPPFVKALVASHEMAPLYKILNTPLHGGNSVRLEFMHV